MNQRMQNNHSGHYHSWGGSFSFLFYIHDSTRFEYCYPSCNNLVAKQTVYQNVWVISDSAILSAAMVPSTRTTGAAGEGGAKGPTHQTQPTNRNRKASLHPYTPVAKYLYNLIVHKPDNVNIMMNVISLFYRCSFNSQVRSISTQLDESGLQATASSLHRTSSNRYSPFFFFFFFWEWLTIYGIRRLS